jgi:hypothetical protein
MGSIRHDGKAGTGCSSSSNRQKSFDDQAARASYVDGAPNPVKAHLLAHSLSATHSCALTGQRAHHISAEVPCGICFGCVLRRASFTASGVTDTTNYIAPSSDPVVQKWLDSKSVEQPVRNFIRRGVRGRDLAALGLPNNYPLRDALDLCQRGVDEFRSLYP